MKKTQKINSNLFSLVEVIVTFFGIGNFKFCPGTWASIATLPIWVFLNLFLIVIGVETNVMFLFVWFIIIIGLFALGIWAVDIYMKKNQKHDSSEIVIDEVVGQLITFVMSLMIMIYFLAQNPGVVTEILGVYRGPTVCFVSLILVAPVIVFRYFDIKKPWIIGRCDKNVKGALGVMLDDVLAGFFTSLVMFPLYFFFVLSL